MDEFYYNEEQRQMFLIQVLEETSQFYLEKYVICILIRDFKCLLQKEFLTNLSDYSGDWYANNYVIFEYIADIAKKIGFIVDECYLRVPDIKPGYNITLAQEILIDFRRKLEKARKSRRLEVTIECEKMKNAIDEGYFRYVYSNCYGEDDFISEVHVLTTESFDTDFDELIIKKYFEEFNIKYLGQNGVECVFKLCK